MSTCRAPPLELSRHSSQIYCIGSITVPELALLQSYMAGRVEGNQISAAESEFSMHGHAHTRKRQNLGDSLQNIRYFLICDDQIVVIEDPSR
ncbi:hypothetical protein CDAR_107001 [Caerostris darwini]|uniref:Uncharacterized protein n=1 Tax=Caerostris darwini TaxID=1538125 RepID=A0AAV4T0G8_9ARAC|nr:hypothetical protein CDAR_107001 [Caerostris darwini]